MGVRAVCRAARAEGGCRRALQYYMREGRQSLYYVPMARQEQGSRRATVRREERGTGGEGRARIIAGEGRGGGTRERGKGRKWSLGLLVVVARQQGLG
jgi:hypothetical protein